MNPPAPRILLVDDHPLLLEGLRTTVASAYGDDAVATCGDTKAAEALMGSKPFDLVALDLVLPGPCPMALTRRLVREAICDAAPKVLFVSAFFTEGAIQRAAQAGAAGFVSKHDPRAEVLRCIAAALRGERAVSAGVEERFPVDALVAGDSGAAKARLSERELEILSYVARGHSTKEIAALTNLKVRTVDRHRSNIMDKTGLHDRVKLTQFAIKEGYCQV